jgi:hypothetical protein
MEVVKEKLQVEGILFLRGELRLRGTKQERRKSYLTV